MSEPNVYLSQSMSAAGVALLTDGCAVLDGPYFGRRRSRRSMRRCDGRRRLVVRSMPVEETLLAAAPELTVVVKNGAGIDAIDLAACSARGIVVASAAGPNAFAVAPQAVTLMLAVRRDVVRLDRMVRDGGYRQRERVGGSLGDLYGATVGLIGFGSIARHVARMVRGGFDADVLVHSPSLSDAYAREAGVTRMPDLTTLLARADIVSLHVPLRPDTRNIIGATELATMKSDACLINTARGGVIDEAALLTALETGRLAGAGLDVFATEPPPADDPLFACGRVILSPHIGGGSDAALRAKARATARAVLDALAGREPEYFLDRAALAGRVRRQ